MWDGINRRKFPRIHYKCQIAISKKGSPKTISTSTENIGAGGICVILKEDLGLFQGVALEVELEGSVQEKIQCNGTVVWVVKKHVLDRKSAGLYDTGIEFVDINPENARRIAKIVEEYLKKSD